MINFSNNTINLTLFNRLIREIKNGNQVMAKSLIDSVSPSQFESKRKLIELLELQGMVKPSTKVDIFGSWFGTILAGYLQPKVTSIRCFDLDDLAIRIGKNALFKTEKNIEWMTRNVFTEVEKFSFAETDLFINTSCEHMPDMKTWHRWHEVKPGSNFAFQSNNKFGLDDHTNCVNSIEEFENQLPAYFKVLCRYSTKIDNYTRYTLIGAIGV